MVKAYFYKSIKKTEFNPTGRYKVAKLNSLEYMYFEHKGFFFNQWIYEDDIWFETYSEEIFTCKSTGGKL